MIVRQLGREVTLLVLCELLVELLVASSEIMGTSGFCVHKNRLKPYKLLHLQAAG